MVKTLSGAYPLRGGFKKGVCEEYPNGFSVNLFIRKFLLSRGRAYGYELYRNYKKELKNIGELNKKKYLIGSYNTFRIHLYILNRLGLIQKIAEEKKEIKKGEKFPCVYWKISSTGLEPGWLNPHDMLYPR